MVTSSHGPFTDTFSSTFALKLWLKIPPHLKHVTEYSNQNLILIFHNGGKRSRCIGIISDHFYPAPDRGTGYCLRAISFFVSVSAKLRENGWTDLHEIFRERAEWPWDDLITFWVNSGKQVNFLLSPAIVQRTGITKSVSFARWQQGAGFVVPCTTACIADVLLIVPMKECW